MTEVMALCIDTARSPRMKRGRPRADESPEALANRKLAALKLMVSGKTREEIAADFGVTTRTIRRWRRDALAAEGEIPDMLRAQERLEQRERTS